MKFHTIFFTAANLRQNHNYAFHARANLKVSKNTEIGIYQVIYDIDAFRLAKEPKILQHPD